MPEMLELERATGAARLDIAQCACGGRFQKFSTLLCSPRLAARLGWLTHLTCARCDAYEEHEERAAGRFPDGSSRAAAAGAYPSELCRAIAAAGEACPLVARRAPPPTGLREALAAEEAAEGREGAPDEAEAPEVWGGGGDGAVSAGSSGGGTAAGGEGGWRCDAELAADAGGQTAAAGEMRTHG